MTLKNAETEITSRLATMLADKGFSKKSNSMLTRPWKDGVAQVRCAVRKDQSSGALFVSLMLGVRFPKVENLLVRPRAERDSPTIGVPIHLLHANPKYADWNVEAPETPVVLLEEIETYAMPFFAKYCSFDQVLFSLTSENPADWFGQTSSHRISMLAVMLSLRGRAKSALALLDNELEERQNNLTPPMIAERQRYQRLRQRISTSFTGIG